MPVHLEGIGTVHGIGQCNMSVPNADKHWQEHLAEMRRGYLWATENARTVGIIGAGECTALHRPVAESCMNGSTEDVTLLDLDEDGMIRGAERIAEAISAYQEDDDRNVLTIRVAPVDITFMLRDALREMDMIGASYIEELEHVRSIDEAGDAIAPMCKEIHRAIDRCMARRRLPEGKDGAFDAVISDCTLSQIIHSIARRAVDMMNVGLERNECIRPRSEKELVTLQREAMTVVDDIKDAVAGRIVADHYRIMNNVTADGGRMFLACDQLFTRYVKYRAGSIPEKPDAIFLPSNDPDVLVHVDRRNRFTSFDGSVRKAIEGDLGGARIVEEREWEWDRIPDDGLKTYDWGTVVPEDQMRTVEDVQGLYIQT